MKRKVLTAVLCATMAVSMVGCGLASTGAADETASEKTTSEAAASSDGKIHLEYFNVKSEVTDIYDTLIAKFEEANPDIEIEQVNVPDPTTVLQTRMSTNDMPDILSHWATDPVFVQMVDNDMLMDLTDQDFMSNVKPDMLSAVEYDGKAYCLPISTNAAGVFYNVDVFEENGIEVPTTYEELIADCDKLQAAGVTPFAFFNQDSHSGQAVEILQVDDVENFEDAFAAIQDGSAKVEDYDGFRKSAEKILELNKYAQEDPFGTTYEQAIADFANGETAMIIGGIWMIPTINEDNADLNYSTFALPASEGMTTMVPYQNDHCLAISSTCENKEAALKFLAFMADPENAQYYADKDGSPSYITGVETTVEESKPLLAYFDSGVDIGIWPDQLWQPGMYDNMNKYADELVQSGDVDAYLANIQSVLSGN